jgi:hypothetical protein
MTPLDGQIHLIILWTVFAGLAVLGVAAVLVWAVRTRQFSNQDHARYLPLNSGIPEEQDSHVQP